jgi:hypothetical protein
MSRYMLGKTECPPQGDMRRPKERGMVSQFDGKRYWVAGWRIEPGESGLMRPSTQTAMVTERKDLVGGWVV